MKDLVVRLFKEEGGQGMAEYGLIIALVAIAAIAGLAALSGGLGDIFKGVGDRLSEEAEKAASTE